jgi:hypothetical protein
METITVTMSLERFKELESYEIWVNNRKEFVIIDGHKILFNDDAYDRLNKLAEADRNDILYAMDQRIDSLRRMMDSLSEIERRNELEKIKRMFARPYSFFDRLSHLLGIR